MSGGITLASEGEPKPVSRAVEMRAVRSRLAEAGDERVLQIVQLVETMAERGEADALLAPLRGRLGVLRPARKMRFSRLLFIPFDRLIVSPATWRMDEPTLPRTALLPLAEIVHASLGAVAQSLDPVIGAIDTTDAAAIGHIGAQFWPLAGRALAASEPPPSWAAQGLPKAAFMPLQTAVAFILRAQEKLADLPPAGGEYVERQLASLLAAAGECGTQCWGMLLALLLQSFPSAETPFRAAMSRRAGKAGDAAQAALTLAAEWIESSAAARGTPDLAHAADEIDRQIVLLDSFSVEPALHQQAARLRVALQAACVAQFEAGLTSCIGARLAAPPDRIAVGAMEQDARNLRRMEIQARRLGNGPAYDRQLREAADSVAAAACLDRFDRIRLVEILAGAPAALRVLKDLKG